MARMPRSVISAALALGLLAYPVIGGYTALGAEKASPTAAVKVGEVKGTLLDSSGKVVERAIIRVTAANGTPVAVALTGKDGKFTLGTLPAGDYALAIDEGRPLTIKVTENAALSSLVIAIPSRPTYSAGAAGPAGLTQTQWIWVVAGGVAIATGAGAAIAASSGGGRHRHRLSP